MAREASLEQTLTDGIEHHMENFHFSIPAIVIRSDLVNMEVDVQPSLNIKMFDGSGSSERPSILNVPLIYPSSKTAGFTFPVNKGDTVLLVFSERGLDAWKGGNGYPSTPTDFRMLDYKDAVAIPGLMPRGRSINNPDKHVLTHNTSDTVMFTNLGGSESEVRLKADGSIEINTSNQPVIVNCSIATVNASESINLNTAQLVVDASESVWIGNITHTGNYTGTGLHTFNGVPFETHKHIGTQPGNGTSGTPVP
jgi:hypothetical protein